MPAADGAKYLQGAKGAPNTYDHLASTILKIITANPAASHELYEHLSSNVKDSAAASAGELSLDEKLAAYLKVSAATDDMKSAAAGFIEGAISLFPKKTDEPPQESHPVEDFIQSASLFEWAGIGFGSAEAFRIHKSLKKLALELTEKGQPIDGLRFWGKILGTGGDYYVAETGPTETADESEAPDNYINSYTYHVCSAPGSPWTTLPPLTSAQVVGARVLRRFFSGDLEAAVPGNPPFPGVEKNLLRAIIGEISADTVVVPTGFFTPGEDDDGLSISQEEELPTLSMEQLLDISCWQHKFLEINAWGRTMKMPVLTNDEGDPIDRPGEPEQKRALRSIEDDEGADKAWTVRAYSGVVAVKNFWWPGACTAVLPTGSVGATPVAPGEAPLGPTTQYASIYVGYGVKAAVKSFTPQMPAAIATECEMPTEEEDPVVEPVREEEDDE